MTTIFTDARLKQHIELRSGDSGNLRHALAFQGLWKGLMYDPEVIDDALRIAPLLSRDDAVALRQAVAREGLDARLGNVRVIEVAKEAVALAVEGLRNIAPDEVFYLDFLVEHVIEDEICPADILLRNWYGSWNASMEKVVQYLRIT